MKTYKEILSAIENLSSTVKPTTSRMYNIVHSDGLTQTHKEDVYSQHIVVSIRKAIWSDNLTLAQKLGLTEALANKLSI